MRSFFDFKLTSIDGADDLLGLLRGQVVLVVNVASECGFTPQYDGLEKLHRELSGQSFSVVGFPCNQFGAQEPGSETEILSFCQTRYRVTFPLSKKVEVNGSGQHRLYAWLTTSDNIATGDIEWNFEKFLIGRDGQVLGRYPSATKPNDGGLLQEIAAAL